MSVQSILNSIRTQTLKREEEINRSKLTIVNDPEPITLGQYLREQGIDYSGLLAKPTPTKSSFGDILRGETKKRFLKTPEEITKKGKGLLKFGKEVGQSIARSFAATKAFLTEDLSKPPEERKPLGEASYTPKTDIEKKIFGTDKPISFKSIGEEVLMVGGEEFKEKYGDYAVPAGMVIAALDLTPIGFGKKQTLEASAKLISKTDDVAKIIKALKPLFKGSDEEIKILANSLKNVNKSDEVMKVFSSIDKGKTIKGVVAEGKGLPAVARGEVVSRPKLPTQKGIPKTEYKPPKPIQTNLSFSKSYNTEYYKQGNLSRVSTEKTLKDVEKTIAPQELGAEKLGLYNKFKESVSNAWVSTREFIQDDWFRVRRLINKKGVKLTEAGNPYEREILYHGRVAERIQEGKDIAKAIDKDIIKTSRVLGINDTDLTKDINRYLIAKHAPERNAVIGTKAAGISTQDALKIVKEIETSKNGKEIIRISNDIKNLNKKTLNMLLDSDIISNDLYATLIQKYKHHVPLYRIFEEAEDVGSVLSGRGFDVYGTGIKGAKGSEREVSDILSNVVFNYEQAVIRSEKNIVDKATLQFYRDNKKLLKGLIEEVKPKAIGKTFAGSEGEKRFIFQRISDPQVLALREKGKPVYLKIKDPHLATALKGINRAKVDGFMRFVQTITRFYSGLATRFNPEFAFPNKIRDLQEAMVYLASKDEIGFKGGAKVVSKDSKSVLDILDFLRGKDTKGTRLYKQMKFDGGTTGGLSLSTKKRVDLNIEKIRELNRSNPKKAAEKLLQTVDDWNTIFEDSTRLSVYKEALSKGVSRQRAAVLAKEASVNFNKFGKGGPTINALYMFSNASIQGSTKMLASMKKPKVAATVITTIGTSVWAVNSYNDFVDPDWREKVSKWDRLNGLPIVIPTKEGVTYFTIPVSWGIKPIKVAMDYAYDGATGKGEGIIDATGGVLASVIEGYNPVGGSDVVSGITPSVLDLPVEIARNKAWYGNAIKPDWDKNAPASIQYFQSLEETTTGKASILFTGELSKLGIEVSPADADYAYRQLIGGAGRFGSDIINTISAVGKGEAPPVREVPFVSRFLRRRTEEEVGYGSGKAESVRKILTEQSRERFKFNQEAEKTYDKLKKMDREKAGKEFDKIIKENPKMAEKINEIMKEENLGLNYTDRLILQLGVENGERAKFIAGELNKLKTDKEKGDYYQELIEKRIISKRVDEQIMELLQESI